MPGMGHKQRERSGTSSNMDEYEMEEQDSDEEDGETGRLSVTHDDIDLSEVLSAAAACAAAGVPHQVAGREQGLRPPACRVRCFCN